MNCTRCQGLMVHELLWDLGGMSSSLRAHGYRCTLCGDVVDAVILENRRRSQTVVGTTTATADLTPALMAA